MALQTSVQQPERQMSGQLMSRARRYATLAVVCAASFTIMLATSAMNIALPSLVSDLSASTRDLQWIVDGYNLAFASFVLAFGSLSDRYGRKGALLLGLSVFAAAAILGSRADSAEELIAAQAIMGLGAAMIFPTTLSIISNTFPERTDRARAIGIWGAVTGIGGGVGPVFGGSLIEGFWWGSILVGLAVLAGVVALGVGAVVVTSRDPATPGLDLVGLALSVLAVGSLVYTVIEAPERGWLAGVTTAGFAASALLFVALVWWELRCPQPMLDMRLFANPRFSAASSAIAFAYFALFGFIFLGTMYLQFVKDYSPLSAGVRLLPVAGAIAVGSLVGTMLAVRIGNKIVVAAGMALFTVGFAWISTADGGTSYPVLVGQMVTIGLALGSTTAPATEAIMGAVSADKAGIGSAMNDATRELGGTLGVAVLGSIYVSIYAENIRSAAGIEGLPDPAQEAAAESIGAAQQIAAGLPDPAVAVAVADGATAAFLDGFMLACFVAAAVTAVAAIITWRFLPARPGVLPAPVPARVRTPQTPDPVPVVAEAAVVAEGTGAEDPARRLVAGVDGPGRVRGPEPDHVAVAARVAGVVRTDPLGDPIPHALVTVSDTAGRIVARTVAGCDGRFVVDDLPQAPLLLTITTASTTRWVDTRVQQDRRSDLVLSG